MVVHNYGGPCKFVNERNLFYRCETIESGSGRLRHDTSEVLTLQIADGDVTRGRAIPFAAFLPRGGFVCASTAAARVFAVDFEVAIAVVFEGGRVAAESVPIVVYTHE